MATKLRYALDGVFAVYKPKGITSRNCVDLVQKSLLQQLTHGHVKRRDRLKMGHGGTLDPLAEGVLVLGVGTGCKQLQRLQECKKAYTVEAQFGSATDTFDSEGVVTETGPVDHLTQDNIRSALMEFQGVIEQKPPIYSALRIQGKRLYEYARQGIPLPKPIQARKAHIYDIKLLAFHKDHQRAVFHVECGGGTYMRSLVSDAGLRLGTQAHMCGLIRTQQGEWTLEKALAIDDLTLEKVQKAMQR